VSQARNTRCVCAYENALTLVGTTLTEWGSMIYGVMMLKQGRGACRRCRMVGMFCAAGLAAAGVTGLGGCDNLARSRGQFQLVGAFGDSAIGAEGHPLNKDLFVPKLDDQGNETEPRTQVPLVKVGHRDPWTGKLLTLTPGSTWSKQSSYMVVDVTNVMRDPTLGSAGDSAKFRTRLMALADLLLVAADANGEVYWRHLTTYLAAHKTVSRTGQVAVGAGTAASFISPVLGASIAGDGAPRRHARAGMDRGHQRRGLRRHPQSNLDASRCPSPDGGGRGGERRAGEGVGRSRPSPRVRLRL
jgi:hypothetical protein